MDLPFMSFLKARVMERFTEVPLSLTSHFTFIFFQGKFVFRLEFCNNFLFCYFAGQTSQTPRRGGYHAQAFVCE